MQVLEEVAYIRRVREERTGYDVAIRGELTNDPLILFRAHFTNGLNDPVYNNEYFNERFDEASRMIDVDARNAIFRELNVIGLDDVPYIPIGAPLQLIYSWPWLKNFYGELEESAWGTAHINARIWIDKNLKAERGF